jgi:hypothetical protein
MFISRMVGDHFVFIYVYHLKRVVHNELLVIHMQMNYGSGVTEAQLIVAKYFYRYQAKFHAVKPIYM